MSSKSRIQTQEEAAGMLKLLRKRASTSNLLPQWLGSGIQPKPLQATLDKAVPIRDMDTKRLPTLVPWAATWRREWSEVLWRICGPTMTKMATTSSTELRLQDSSKTPSRPLKAKLAVVPAWLLTIPSSKLSMPSTPITQVRLTRLRWQALLADFSAEDPWFLRSERPRA